MNNLFLGTEIILLGGLISFFCKERFKGVIVSIFSGLGTVFLLTLSISILLSGKTISTNISMSYPINTVNIVIDPLSAFFIVIISVMSFLGTLYAVGYIKQYYNQKQTIASHFFFLSVFISSMILVVVVQNAIAFLIVWEIMSISSFFLTVFENENDEVFKAGIDYFVTMHIGVAFLISGFILLSIQSNGSFDFASFKAVLIENKDFASLIFIIFFVGFGIKAGFMPFHIWLPKAHTAAPSNISGMMSGIMIKIGIYGILRMLTLIGTPSESISYLVLFISLITAIFGIMYAIAQHDLKKILAYCSVENIGIIGIGISIGMLGLCYKNNLMAILGFSGSILHILNHSIFKGLLFYSAGAIYKTTHTRNIEELGGIIKRMKYTSIFFLVGSIAICGLPPLNGFISEFLLYLGMLKAVDFSHQLFGSVCAVVSIALLSFVGAMALLCFAKVFSVVFLGLPRSDKVETSSEVDRTMLLPMGILSGFCILIGIFPQFAFNLVEKPVVVLIGLDTTNLLNAGILNILTCISLCNIIFIGLAVLIYSLRYLLLRKRSIHYYKTWDCGYQAGNSKIQYSGSSFTRNFLFLLNPFMKKQIHIKPPAGLFPKEAMFESHSTDLVETFIVNPVIILIRRFLNLFSWIQTGNTQQYIVYGLIFLVAILISVIW